MDHKDNERHTQTHNLIGMVTGKSCNNVNSNFSFSLQDQKLSKETEKVDGRFFLILKKSLT